jgi:hypothetical protein
LFCYFYHLGDGGGGREKERDNKEKHDRRNVCPSTPLIVLRVPIPPRLRNNREKGKEWWKERENIFVQSNSLALE